MRTNIEIDDDLMAAAMEAGGFKTKKEAVEEGLRLVRRRKVYEGLLALRGKLQWDDSEEGWARAGAQAGQAMQEPEASFAEQAVQQANAKSAGKPSSKAKTPARSKAK
jgi:Arc/MetJ family transcription regulator